MKKPAITEGPRTEAEAIAWADWCASFMHDPLGFVLAVYPWGEGALASESGPDAWQCVVLDEIGAQLREGRTLIRIAVASGHGIGKTALMAWIIHWFESCYPKSAAVVTANTMQQLTTKTWRELAKWRAFAINHWQFEWTKTAYSCRLAPETWFASAVPWSEHNSQAFAGLHEDWVLVCFDEASRVADVIWEVTEGAFTTRGFWLVFGNPTENTGRFHQCWERFKKRWTTLRVDSRDSKKANKRYIQELIEDHGEDSDYIRVRVRGLPPIGSSVSFISPASVRRAVERTKTFDPLTIVPAIPKLMGVDVARQGEDESVVILRQGRFLSPTIHRYHIADLMQLSSAVARLIDHYKPDVVFIDETGLGAGVVDRLRQLGYGVIGVHAGAKPDSTPTLGARRLGATFKNKRAEMWSRMREWVDQAAILPDDPVLRQDLETPGYSFDASDRLQLESKEQIKARGGKSPDVGDAIALTFAVPVAVKIQDRELQTEPDVV